MEKIFILFTQYFLSWSLTPDVFMVLYVYHVEPVRLQIRWPCRHTKFKFRINFWFPGLDSANYCGLLPRNVFCSAETGCNACGLISCVNLGTVWVFAGWLHLLISIINLIEITGRGGGGVMLSIIFLGGGGGGGHAVLSFQICSTLYLHGMYLNIFNTVVLSIQ